VGVGAKVVVSGRNEAALAAAVRELGASARGVAADTGRLDGIDRVVAATREFGAGRLDVLFCNAGIGAFGPIATITEQ
jgi:NAD(P)-dependent dehydrogenase (short-subunit alcohol dehydrogenase family)